MLNRLTKIGEAFAYLGLAYVSFLFVRGHLDLHFSFACVSLSALWLALTAVEMHTLLRSYFDVLSRLKVRLPFTFGVVLSGLAIFVARPEFLAPLALVAAVEIVGWLVIFARYKQTSALYRKQGHGPLPRGAWVNPNCNALQEGDLILTSGRMANKLHETVGHGEIVVQVGGKTMCLSSYMEKGTVLNPLTEVAANNLNRGHYIALRLVKPLNADQKAVIPALATIMLDQTNAWKAAAVESRAAFYKRFHVPAFVQKLVDKKLTITGYDWFGLFTGRLATDHWTCIGACLELLHRVGVKTNNYGTGVLGLGTGVLDPIMPVRFLADPAFRLLTLEDEKAFLKTLAA